MAQADEDSLPGMGLAQTGGGSPPDRAPAHPSPIRSCAGDWVAVRSRDEILATLDRNGRLDGMPFMPEMFSYCGQRIRVARRGHKSCDTLHPVSSRSLVDGVLLEGVRCSGAAHGGCQAACSVFWKEAWLRRIDASGAELAPAGAPATGVGQGCTESQVIDAARNGVSASGKPRWQCQATDFPAFTKLIGPWNISQFAEDLASRNVGLGTMLKSAAYFAYEALARPRSRFGAPGLWLYDRFQSFWGGVPYPRRWGRLENAAEAPIYPLGLQPGELVRVKPLDEILMTIDARNHHRGLYFDGEMVPYCGGVYRVRARVERFLDEKTGVMRTMKTPAVILENVWCRGLISGKRVFCPRAIYCWWREAWLERAPDASAPTVETALGAKSYLKEVRKELGERWEAIWPARGRLDIPLMREAGAAWVSSLCLYSLPILEDLLSNATHITLFLVIIL
ncbi:hypothetical protein MKI84_20075 [Ancylobacter sp. A5.8]|uniref:hypothetical protein n=1 Tax=Ancylobacter gelatini TaxID=2919920 RepID=UPI001F4E8DF8|nr:hypothetical protein [Ancylobacter gelatini]MCJ8145226.1 hypothetical protein [Ancylobacter gelatini]